MNEKSGQVLPQLALILFFSAGSIGSSFASDPVIEPEVMALAQRGYSILTRTKEMLPGHVGNELNCTSCHLDGGKTSYAAPWAGIVGAFPEYRARSGKVITLVDRINDCFERSLNGRALNPKSEEMVAILSYMRTISDGIASGPRFPGRGFKKLARPESIDREQGKSVYNQKCAACHGVDGQGVIPPGSSIKLAPPLWGPHSFNIGAGMARRDTAANFIQVNMPRGTGGTLTIQEAFNIADYFINQPRPDFRGKSRDWPKGQKPADARY